MIWLRLPAMALTDWVFPEMGYTCEQDKRALYEKKIAPVYSGVTDNRSRMAEGNFCHTLVLPVKICGKRKGDKQMKPYLKAEEIRKENREQLPVIDEETFREHYCSECMYYAGRINKKARCMQRQCSWDKDDEFFAPALKRMIPILDREYKQAEEQYFMSNMRIRNLTWLKGNNHMPGQVVPFLHYIIFSKFCSHSKFQICSFR